MSNLEQISLSNAAQMNFSTGETVVSGYFVGQMAAMLLNGFRARRMGRRQNEQSMTFQQELNDIRQEFAKEKSQAELEFLRECHESGMAFQRESARKSCENRKQEEEFRKFCETSWLTHFRPEIGAILEAMEHPNLDNKGVAKIKLLIARTLLVAKGVDKKGAYSDFCEDFKEDYLRLFSLNIDGVWLKAWERDCVCPMADTMNLHYVMQGMPAVVLYPMQRGSIFSLETATWGYQLGQTGMVFNKMFRMPMSELETYPNRLDKLLLAAAAYIDDCYRVLLCQSVPDSLYKLKDCLQEDDYVWTLLCGKYQSLVETTEKTRNMLLLEDKEMEKLQKTVKP